MAALLSKLRIEFSDIIVIPDITKKAEEATKAEFDELIEPLMCKTIFDSELIALREKTNRHLRLRELLLKYSKDSALIVM
jgi:solute carrier family 12 sodium/potassium/chloride transporter 2